jgi:hypothetical protein
VIVGRARLGVAGDGEVDVGEAPEVLVVRLQIKVAVAERDRLRRALAQRLRRPHDAVVERIEHAEQIVHLQRQHHVRLADHRAAAEGVIERVPGGEVHAPALVDHRALQGLGQFDQPPHAGRRARHAVADDDRVLGRGEQLRRLRQRADVAHRRHHLGDLGNAQAAAVGDRVLLQLGVEREQHRAHGRRGRDLVGAYRRLGEMLQRGRLVVPLDEVAHDRGGVDRRVDPFDPGRALVRLDDVADHHVHRHPVAPGIVQRHAGVLQADRAVADHGDRLAFDLGVALRHVDGDLLVRAGEDFRLVAAVVDDRLVQAAEARGAVHRQVVEVEGLEHVDHELAAARGLVHRVGGRRQALGRRQPGPGHGGLEVGAGRCRLRVRGGRGGERGGAGERGALEEFAPVGARQVAAGLGHRASLARAPVAPRLRSDSAAGSHRAAIAGKAGPPLALP